MPRSKQSGGLLVLHGWHQERPNDFLLFAVFMS